MMDSNSMCVKGGGLQGTGRFKKQIRLYGCYTAVFIVASLFVAAYFYQHKVSPIWDVDGLYQHYNAFVYLGIWCRKIIKTLIYDHKFIIPLWEWGLGYGADIIITLGYYAFGDFFALISVITPEKYAEAGYVAAILLRFYAAGFVFCLYAKKMGCRSWTTICASIMYVFCFNAIFAGPRHPYFMLPMIYLPLVWLGCEKIIRKEPPFLFVLAVFLSAFSNFYFFYMIVLLTVLYVAVRLLSEKQYRDIKLLGKYLLQFIGWGVLGVAMASVLFLPNVLTFLGDNTRISGMYKFNLFYFRKEYEMLPGSAIAPYSAMLWEKIGMFPMAYLGVGACFLQKKEDNWAKLYFVAEVLFLLFPAAGYVLNGMGYVSNRWSFAWSLVVAFMFAKFFPVLPEFGIRKKITLSIGCILYAILCLSTSAQVKYAEFVLTGVVLLLLSMLFAWFVRDTGVWQAGRVKIQKAFLSYAGTFLLLFICLYVEAGQLFEGQDYIQEFAEGGQAEELLNGEYKAVKKCVDGEGFYRIEAAGHSNYKVSNGQSTTNFYWSLINPNVSRFLQYNNAYKTLTHTSKGLLSRAFLLPLVDAKYFVASGSEDVVPYGYEKIQDISQKGRDRQRVYKTENSLPMGYTYDKGIPLEEYEKMTIPERQQAMLQGAVIEDGGKVAGLGSCTPVYEDGSIPYKVICGKNTEFDGHTLTAKSKNASITLSLDSPVDGELYVEFLGMDFQSGPFDWNEEKGEGWIPETEAVLAASCNGVRTSAHHYTEFHKYAHGRKDYLLNLGYSTDNRKTIEVEFSEKGIYTIDALNVICQRMTHYKSWLGRLQEDVLENVQITTNHISGTIDVGREKLLCLSVPYSEGWSAYVDGEKTDLLCTNIMLSGIMLEPGSHSVELVYQTPYLVPGLVISILGIIVTAFLWFFRRFLRHTDLRNILFRGILVK